MTTEPTELALITVHFAREKLQALDLLASIFGAMTWEKTDEDSTEPPLRQPTTNSATSMPLTARLPAILSSLVTGWSNPPLDLGKSQNCPEHPPCQNCFGSAMIATRPRSWTP